VIKGSTPVVLLVGDVFHNVEHVFCNCF